MTTSDTPTIAARSAVDPITLEVIRHGIVCLLGLASCMLSGCQDGPLYALKAANPYYVMGEWKRDEAIGVTDHERRKQLTILADTIDQLPAEKQRFWAGHLEKMIENDDSPALLDREPARSVVRGLHHRCWKGEIEHRKYFITDFEFSYARTDGCYHTAYIESRNVGQHGTRE